MIIPQRHHRFDVIFIDFFQLLNGSRELIDINFGPMESLGVGRQVSVDQHESAGTKSGKKLDDILMKYCIDKTVIDLNSVYFERILCMHLGKEVGYLTQFFHLDTYLSQIVAGCAN